MIKETYERLLMDVTEFDVEDIITTSGEGGDVTNSHSVGSQRFEDGLMPFDI